MESWEEVFLDEKAQPNQIGKMGESHSQNSSLVFGSSLLLHEETEEESAQDVSEAESHSEMGAGKSSGQDGQSWETDIFDIVLMISLNEVESVPVAE